MTTTGTAIVYLDDEQVFVDVRDDESVLVCEELDHAREADAMLYTVGWQRTGPWVHDFVRPPLEKWIMLADVEQTE